MNTKLLKLLSKDSRTSVADMATMLGTSEEAVAREIAEMERSGVIRGYKAVLRNVNKQWKTSRLSPNDMFCLWITGRLFFFISIVFQNRVYALNTNLSRRSIASITRLWGTARFIRIA